MLYGRVSALRSAMWCTRHSPGPSGCTEISSPHFEGSWWLRVAPPLPGSRRARWEEGVPMRRRLLDPETSSYEIPLRCSRHSRWRLGGQGQEEERAGVYDGAGRGWAACSTLGRSRERRRQLRGSARLQPATVTQGRTVYIPKRPTPAQLLRGGGGGTTGTVTGLTHPFASSLSSPALSTAATTSLHLLGSHLGLLLLLGLVLSLRVGAALLVLSG